MLLLRIQSLLIAIYLFFAGFIYGDGPREMEFTCTIPSGVYEYEAGDNIVIEVTSKNVGKPFSAKTYQSMGVCIYQIIDGELVYLHDTLMTSLPAEFPNELIKNGYIDRGTFEFTVLEDAPKGDYIISVSQFGCGQKFENMIKVV